MNLLEQLLPYAYYSVWPIRLIIIFIVVALASLIAIAFIRIVKVTHKNGKKSLISNIKTVLTILCVISFIAAVGLFGNQSIKERGGIEDAMTINKKRINKQANLSLDVTSGRESNPISWFNTYFQMNSVNLNHAELQFHYDSGMLFSDPTEIKLADLSYDRDHKLKVKYDTDEGRIFGAVWQRADKIFAKYNNYGVERLHKMSLDPDFTEDMITGFTLTISPTAGKVYKLVSGTAENKHGTNTIPVAPLTN